MSYLPEAELGFRASVLTFHHLFLQGFSFIALPEKRENASTVASGLLASEAVGVGVRSPVMSGPLKSLDKRMSFTTHRARQIGHVGPVLGPVSIHSSMQM